MTTTSALTGPQSATYPRARAQVLRFLGIYYDKLIDAPFLEDLDEFVAAVVTPWAKRTVDPRLFDDAFQAYVDIQALKDGTHEELHRSPSGVVDNTLSLLDHHEDNILDPAIRNLLNSIGVS